MGNKAIDDVRAAVAKAMETFMPEQPETVIPLVRELNRLEVSKEQRDALELAIAQHVYVTSRQAYINGLKGEGL